MCVIGFFLSIFAALIPAAVYSWFVNWLDRHEKEPWWLLALVFVWGAFPAFVLAVIAQLILDIPTTWVLAEETVAYELTGGSLWAPVSEEIAKGLGVVLILLLAHREIDSVLDGVVFGAMAGLGFAFTENIFYFGSALAEDGWGGWALVVLMRTVPFGLNHALFTGLTGAGLAAASLTLRPLLKIIVPPLGLTAGMLFHSVHNLGASLAATNCATLCLSLGSDWGGILMLGVVVSLIWRQEKSWMSEHLPGEVTAEVLEAVTSWRGWTRARWEAAVTADREKWLTLGQVRQAATELAFKKRRLALDGPDAKTSHAIQHYRQQLVELRVTPSRQAQADGQQANEDSHGKEKHAPA